MAPSKSIWFHIGHAYERARLVGRPSDEERHPRRALARRRATEPAERTEAPALPWPEADELLGAAAWLVLDRIVARGRPVRRPGLFRLVGAGLAGAGAALLVELVRPLLDPRDASAPLDEQSVDRILTGAGQGLVYGALVEPRVPGSALVKGALYGSVEYATDPAGGLTKLLSSHTPQGKLPVIGELISVPASRERAYLEHLVFGIALALLYESSRSSNGTRLQDDAEGS